MIRCQLEVVERASSKKDTESREARDIVARRLGFDELLRRDEHRWLAVTEVESLRCLAERAQRELVAGDFGRFVDWIAATHGFSFARAAGLPVRRPRLELAS